MIFKQKHLQQILPSLVQNLAKGLERNPPTLGSTGLRPSSGSVHLRAYPSWSVHFV